jgi:hypothetical protein
MRFSVGKMESRRGAGLGNEIFPLAKAYLGARAFNARLVYPAWRLNPRRYDRDLGGGFISATGYHLASVLPRLVLDANMIRATGEDDYYNALESLRSVVDRPQNLLIQHTSGMQGGYLGIQRSRPFLQRLLLGSSSALAVVEQLPMRYAQPTVRIGAHVRRGDFRAESVDRGSFNVSLPLEWYRRCIESFVDEIDLPFEIYLATDSDEAELRKALTIRGQKPKCFSVSPLGDLALLGACDLVVSSVSSFSMLALFLSDSPYVWYEGQLTRAGGWLGIWAHEGASDGGGATLRSVRRREAQSVALLERGVAQGDVPLWREETIRHVRDRALLRWQETDLIYYGAVEPHVQNT